MKNDHEITPRLPSCMSSSSPAFSSSQTASRPARVEMLCLLAWCALCAGVPVLLLRSIKPKDERSNIPVVHSAAAQDVIDVPKTIAALQAANPEYIGIGNSMLFTRLGTTPDQMNALTHK